MARRKPTTVRVTYRGQADEHMIPGPSGRVYTFTRGGPPVEVLAEDAPYFVSTWRMGLSDLEPPASEEVEAPESEKGAAEEAPVAEILEVAEPVSGPPEGTAEE